MHSRYLYPLLRFAGAKALFASAYALFQSPLARVKFASPMSMVLVMLVSFAVSPDATVWFQRQGPELASIPECHDTLNVADSHRLGWS
ncbi:MAG: hypothetical protein ACYCPA_08500 [Acidithiobacillus sp.]